MQPDTICLHTPFHCQQCGLALTDTPTMSERRQVCGLPQPRLYVQEHQVFQRQCSCGCVQRGAFPAQVAAPLQYGPRIYAQSILLNIDYKLPFAKIRPGGEPQFWADVVVNHAYNPAPLAVSRKSFRCN